MPQQLEVTPDYRVNYYDSVTGEPCQVKRVVDITDVSPNLGRGMRSLLVYFIDSQRMLVELVRTYPGERFMGTRIDFSIAGLPDQMHVAPRDDTFGLWAVRLGLTKTQLKELIERYVPTGCDLDELQGVTEKLLALLKDRQPGLMTWNGFLKDRLEEMHQITSQALGK